MRTLSLTEEQVAVIGEALTEKMFSDEVKKCKNEEKMAKLKEETDKLKEAMKVNSEMVKVLGYVHMPEDKFFGQAKPEKKKKAWIKT